MTTYRSGYPTDKSVAQGRIDYTITTYATYVQIAWTTYLEVDSSKTTSKAWTVATTMIGDDFSISFAAGQTSGTHQGTSQTETITRISTAQTYTNKISAKHASSSWANKSFTITIPALPTQYTVTYMPNGGSGAPASETYYSGYPITVSTTKPTRDNYTFSHWLGSNGTVYQGGDELPSTSDITLTAQWVWAGGYKTITYNSNRHGTAPVADYATNSESATSTYTWTVASMGDITSSSTSLVIYKFLGWSTSSTATSATYLGGTTGQTTSDLYLYAVWQYQPQSYTITYNTMDGVSGPSPQTWQCTSESGTSITLSSTTPTKAGFTFQGWSKTSSVTSTSGLWQPSESVTLTNNDGSFTLYAIWTPDSAYTYLQGQQQDSLWRTFMLYKVTDEDTYTTIEVKTGLYVDGGQTTTKFINELRYNGVISQSADKSAAARLKGLYLVINEKTFTITKTADVQTVSIGSVLYVDSSTSSTNSSVTETFTISAAPTVTITYNANGGSGAPPTGYKVQGGTYYIGHTGGTSEGTAIEPIRAAHSFLGWATSSSAQTAEYVTGDTYTTDSPLNLYAVWGDSYTEKTVSGVSSATDICEWKNNTIAAISGTSVYQIDVGGNVVSTTTITSYTGSAKMCYAGGILFVMTDDYIALIPNSGTITYVEDEALTTAVPTTYGIFGFNDIETCGTLTTPIR